MQDLRDSKYMELVKDASEYPAIQKPYAIVVGLDCITGLQTARILARHEVPVIGIAKNPKHFCCRTRVCKEIFFADTTSDEFVNTLATLGLEFNQKAVLFPCTDMTVLLISRHRKRLEDRYHIVMPEPDVVEMLIDKVSFYTYAKGQGLALPRTFFLHNRGDAERVIGKLNYPCVLKPPFKTPNWEKHTKAKVFKISNREELLSHYDRCSRWAEFLIVQEWVHGKDANLYDCACYFNSDSEPIVTFVSRKVRKWPPEVGVSSLSEECRNDTVLQETIALFQIVRFRGLCYLEMKRDDRDGKYYIIEPNIGRPVGHTGITEAGEVELIYGTYCDTIGRPLPTNLAQNYKGVKWIYLRWDLQSALYYWRRGNITLREWLQSWRGRKTYAVFSWNDPAPFLADMLRFVYARLKASLVRSFAKLYRREQSSGMH
jgi:D-aspartate ligase